jgi:hypothetical protein
MCRSCAAHNLFAYIIQLFESVFVSSSLLSTRDDTSAQRRSDLAISNLSCPGDSDLILLLFLAGEEVLYKPPGYSG